jgi:hypothetical protein
VLYGLTGVLGFTSDRRVMAGVAVAIVGIVYLIVSRWIVSLCPDWLSARLSGPVVAGLVAAGVATSMWLIGGGLSGGPELREVSLAERLLPITQGLIGGAVGGAIGGAVLEILGIDRSDYHI